MAMSGAGGPPMPLDEDDRDAPMDQEAVEAELERAMDVAAFAEQAEAEAVHFAVVAMQGAPKALAEDLGADPPRKLPFEVCYNKVQEMTLEPNSPPEPRYVPLSDEQTADFLDLPLTKSLPTDNVIAHGHGGARLSHPSRCR